jgi:hypothetical protein
VTAARTYLAGIKERAEGIDYLRENGSSDALHASAAVDLKALHAAVTGALALHYEGIAYADDVPEGGNEPVPEDYERHYCHQDGETWPCPTVAAIAEALEGK